MIAELNVKLSNILFLWPSDLTFQAASRRIYIFCVRQDQEIRNLFSLSYCSSAATSALFGVDFWKWCKMMSMMSGKVEWESCMLSSVGRLMRENLIEFSSNFRLQRRRDLESLVVNVRPKNIHLPIMNFKLQHYKLEQMTVKVLGKCSNWYQLCPFSTIPKSTSSS